MSTTDRNNSAVGAEKRRTTALAPTQSQINRTLLDIIREEESSGGSLFGHKDKKSWKAFRDRLRLKRAGAAWTSSVHIPASDIPIENNSATRFSSNLPYGNNRSFMSRRNSVRFTTVSPARSQDTEEGNDGSAGVSGPRPQMIRRASSRFGAGQSDTDIQAVDEGPPEQSFRPHISRHNSVRFVSDVGGDEAAGQRRLGDAVAEERSMSAREAVAAQEAAEAARETEEESDEEDKEEGSGEGDDDDDEDDDGEGGGDGEPALRMSLMDLLEETDRQMGVVGSRYKMEEYDDEEEEEEDEDGDGSGDGGEGGVERTCCVCMVRHKGAAFIPCGHTFCRLCSRELWVQRGNCPLCNGYILEILDIF